MLRSEADTARHTEQAEAQFRQLVRQWHEETGGLSSPRKIIGSPAYQQVIAMGEAAVPLILKEFQVGRGMFWDHALWQITGENPTDESMRGKPELIDAAWLKWGREHKYI